MKYTPDRVQKIIDLIRAGNYKETACQASGICQDTLYRWIKEKPEFSEAIKKAQSEAEARNVMIIQKAAEDTWQASAWWLERTNWKKWGKKDKMEITGSDEQELKINININGINAKFDD